jgi:Uncharacterized protein conserved in bacteria
MSSTRDRALAAAVHLVGSRGVRELTHVRVDAEAALPKGSTSNYFRTRAALVSGVIGWIAEQERADLAAAVRPSQSVDDVIDALCAVLDDLTGLHAERTRARYALFFEMTSEPDVQAPLRAQRARFAEWIRELLLGLGAPNPDAATRALLAFASGLIVHRLTVDPSLPLRPVVAVAVKGCLQA